MIIECAGLPGAGKTTVCNLVSRPHGKKSSVPLSSIRPGGALLRSAWSIFSLCLAARHFRFNRLRRGFSLVIFLRHYQHREKIILLDQGQVQKLWSILVDSQVFSEALLDNVLRALKPLAPDAVVWVDMPVEAAADRVSTRSHGNSRYDQLLPDAIRYQFGQKAPLLRQLVNRYCAMSGAKLIELDGTAPPAGNAEQIDALL